MNCQVKGTWQPTVKKGTWSGNVGLSKMSVQSGNDGQNSRVEMQVMHHHFQSRTRQMSVNCQVKGTCVKKKGNYIDE